MGASFYDPGFVAYTAPTALATTLKDIKDATATTTTATAEIVKPTILFFIETSK